MAKRKEKTNVFLTVSLMRTVFLYRELGGQSRRKRRSQGRFSLPKTAAGGRSAAERGGEKSYHGVIVYPCDHPHLLPF